MGDTIDTGSADVDATVESGVLVVTLNRPRARNALSLGLLRGLGNSLDIAEERGDIRVLVLTGAGGAFSAGGDSGSIIVHAETRAALALLFAGGDSGGTNGKGFTYANPLHTVLDTLKIDLAL